MICLCNYTADQAPPPTTFAQVSRKPTVRLNTSRPGVESGSRTEIALALELHRRRRRLSPASAGSTRASREHLERIRIELGGEIRGVGIGLA